MKTHDLKSLDQSETQIVCDRLNLHAANLRGMVHTAEGQLVSQPNLVAGDVIANIRILETHCTELESRLNGAAPAFDFSASRPTVNSTSAGSAAGERKDAASAKNQTFTDRVLAAWGVKTLAELSTKMAGVHTRRRCRLNKSFTHETDNLSKMGLFTASGLLFNPQLDISKQQLTALQSIEKNIGTLASRPDIWS